MGNEIKVDLSQTKYKDIAELKGAASEELKDKNKVGGAYSDNGQDQIFGGDGFKEGVSKDEVLAELKERGLSEDVANGLWAVANTNADDDIIDADEFATLISSYESDFNDSKKGSVTLTSWINNLDNPKDGTITTTGSEADSVGEGEEQDGVSAEEESAQLSKESGDLVADMQAEAAAQEESAAEEKSEEEAETKEIAYTDQFKNFDAKVKQDENGQYYVETDKWDTNAKDNLDCISRIIYNTYGVGYKSEEGQQILAALQAANPGTPFEKGLVYPNQRINLIDASEILGLTVADSEAAEGAEESEGAEAAEGGTPTGGAAGTDEKPAEGDSDGEEPAAGEGENKQQLTLEQRTQNLEGVKTVHTDGRTVTFEGVNANGETVTYTQDYKGDLVGNVKTAIKDENGNITQENSYREDGTFTASWYEAGHYPLPSSKAECDAQGNRTGVTFYTYDANHPNKVTERQICDGQSNLIQKETITWDSEYKTVTERHYYNAEGVETDKDGNVLNQNEPAAGAEASGAEKQQVTYTRNDLLALGADAANEDSFAEFLKVNNLDVYKSSIEDLQTAANTYTQMMQDKQELAELRQYFNDNGLGAMLEEKFSFVDGEGNTENHTISYELQYMLDGAGVIDSDEDFSALCNGLVGHFGEISGNLSAEHQEAIKAIMDKYGKVEVTVNEKYAGQGSENNYSTSLNMITQASSTEDKIKTLNTALSASNLTAQQKADLINDAMGNINGAGKAKDSIKTSKEYADNLRTNINNVLGQLTTEEVLSFAQDFELAYGEPLYTFMDQKDNSEANKAFANKVMELYSNATSANYEAIAKTFPITESVQDMLKGKEETSALSTWFAQLGQNMEGMQAGSGKADPESYGISYERFQELTAYADNAAGVGRSTSAFVKTILDSNEYDSNEKMYLIQRLFSGNTNKGSWDNFANNFRDGNDKFQEEYLEKLVHLYVDYKSQK